MGEPAGLRAGRRARLVDLIDGLGTSGRITEGRIEESIARIGRPWG